MANLEVELDQHTNLVFFYDFHYRKKIISMSLIYYVTYGSLIRKIICSFSQLILRKERELNSFKTEIALDRDR